MESGERVENLAALKLLWLAGLPLCCFRYDLSGKAGSYRRRVRLDFGSISAASY